MAAETLTSNQAGPTGIVHKQYLGGALLVKYGQYDIAANVEDGDIFEMCKVPAGALVVGGEFWSEDLDTGTEALDMDVGWAANGGGSETLTTSEGQTFTNAFGTADADGFADMGVLTGDTITTEPQVAAGNYRRFHKFTTGPKYAARETTIQVEANVAANVFAAGTIWVRVEYLMIG